MAHREPPDVAFVLSGGAALGAVQVGMLRALYEHGVRPDVIVGTSAGALNGAFIASRPQTVETADALGAVWRELTRGGFPVNPITGLLGFLGCARPSGARVRPAPARQEARGAPGARCAPDPVARRRGGRDQRRGAPALARTRLDAVLASCAVPGVLAPVPWADRLLMDGGVANNTPISHAVELGAQRIYVLPTGHACALQEPPRGALGMALHAISLLTHRRLMEDIERHGDDAELIVLPPPCPLSVTPIEFHRADELIARALDDARDFIASGGEDRPPIRMRMHRPDLPTSQVGRPPVLAARILAPLDDQPRPC